MIKTFLKGLGYTIGAVVSVLATAAAVQVGQIASAYYSNRRDAR